MLWVVLNGLCATVSVSLLILIAFFHKQQALLYFIYNLTRTTVWCLEVMLAVGCYYPQRALQQQQQQQQEERRRRPMWQYCVAIALAIFFLVDSGHVIYHLKKYGSVELWQPHQLIIRLAIDATFFTGACIDAQLWWRKMKEDYASLNLGDESGNGVEDPWSTHFDDDEATGDFEIGDEMEMT